MSSVIMFVLVATLTFFAVKNRPSSSVKLHRRLRNGYINLILLKISMRYARWKSSKQLARNSQRRLNDLT